jgi:hypothetical protein
MKTDTTPNDNARPDDVNFLPVSIEKMRNDTAAVGDYMAQLGASQYADFRNRRLYIQYDIASQVPFWVLAAAVIILIISLLS